MNYAWQLLEQWPVRHATAYSCRAELHMGLRCTQHEPSAFGAAALGTWQAKACLGCLSEAKQAAVFATRSSHPGLMGQRENTALCRTAAVCAKTLVWLLQVFFIFAVVTNLLVSTSMLQGCVAVVNALTGVNIYGEHCLICTGRTMMSAAQQAQREAMYTQSTQSHQQHEASQAGVGAMATMLRLQAFLTLSVKGGRASCT